MTPTQRLTDDLLYLAIGVLMVLGLCVRIVLDVAICVAAPFQLKKEKQSQ